MTPGNSTGNRRRSLATRLAWLFGTMMVVILLLVGGTNLVTGYQGRRQEIIRGQQAQAAQVATIIDLEVERVVEEMRIFVQSQDLMAMSVADAILSLRQFLQSSFALYDDVTLLDTDGRERARVTRQRIYPPDELIIRGYPDYVQGVLGGAPYAISGVRWSEGGTKVLVAVPTRTLAKDMTGVLVVQLDVGRLWDERIVPRLEIGRGGYAYLVNPNGAIIACDDRALTVTRTDVSALPPVAAFRRGQAESAVVGRYTGLKGVPVIGIQTTVPSTRWGIVVETPVALAFADIRRMTAWLVTLLGVALLVSIALGTLFSRRLVRPLQELRQAAMEIGQGRLDHAIEIRTGDEVEALAEAFTQMARRLKESYDEIERWGRELEVKVAERTQELATAVETQARLLETIRRMSTPVVPVYEGVVVMPLVGLIDARRAQTMTRSLLAGIERHRTRVALLDVTGVPTLDEMAARCFVHMTRAARLLGTEVVLVGITPQVARTLEALGIDLATLTTRTNLQSGIEYALRRMGRRVTVESQKRERPRVDKIATRR
ncbi:MAG TPA: HAMP domain-containing protein [Anaerolineae bacterium]|nr:HAMP domain-containing protein [Anaerolineae bacterium]